MSMYQPFLIWSQLLDHLLRGWLPIIYHYIIINQIALKILSDI